jgi:capsular exopolysaccharide synthesis family protein
MLSVRLASAYAAIALREPVQKATLEVLGINVLPDYEAVAVPNSPFIEIRVTDSNPALAQAVANELANQLILASPTSSQQEDQERAAFINQQLTQLQQNIVTTQEEIAKSQETLQELDSAVEIANMQDQILALETKLSLLQTNYSTLVATTAQGAENTLSMFEIAELPNRPIGPNKLLIILVSLVAGFTLAAGAAYLLEFIDRTIKSPEDTMRIFGVPVIGFVGQIQNHGNTGVYIADQPRSPFAEAFRGLRSNIDFAGVDSPIKLLFVTSPEMGDGKTTVATNLAIAMAQSDRKVALLDADLRRPSVHTTLNLSNQPGLTDVFRDRLNVIDALRPWKDKRLLIMTAGKIPPNPAELLGSKRMEQVLNHLAEIVDIVIIDGPPAVVTDAAVLASKADGVLLVLRPGQTRDDSAKAIYEQFKRAGAYLIGVVFNRIPPRSSEFYGGYQYLSPYVATNYLSENESPETPEPDTGSWLRKQPTQEVKSE